MENIQFIDLNLVSVLILFVVGFVGGMVSGFIGSGGAFVLTPAMMSMGVPGMVAVASNMAHKFPKALVGAHKRNKYGQVDIKLGLVMGLFAEFGVLFGKHIMVGIKESFGAAGTNLYVSFVFVVVLAIVGGMVLRDAIRERRGERIGTQSAGPSKLVQRVRRIIIPGTMVHLKSVDARVSFLVIAPLGFATGLLAATIAVGGFIGVPAMMYILGLPAIMASATELVVAFVMGLGGSLFYALEGYVDIRLSMIILAGSLFGIQIGAIGTTYVKDHVVKFVMAAIMLLVLVSRFFYIPGYLSELGSIPALAPATIGWLDGIGQAALVFALLFGGVMILQALYQGIREHRAATLLAPAPQVIPVAAVAGGPQLSPLGRFERFLVASDGSDFSAAAVREAIGLARRCGAEVHLMSLIATGVEYEAMGTSILKQEIAIAQAHLDEIRGQAVAAGVRCETHLIQGSNVHQEICDLAEQLNVDLIVMGRRGRRGLARMMLGHATAQVIGLAHCSVLVVPRAAHIEARRLLLATDGSRFAEAAAITAGSLARACGAPMTVLSVTTESHGPERRALAEQVVARVLAHLRGEGIAADGQVLQGEPSECVIGLAREREVDLIVTGSHGRTGLERALLGSTSERILNATPCAVLVTKAG
ncbi:permease [Thiocystis minor]|uniref:TSUP family transporter n=1 Tax=Thiocystis minor TaxID=61597 RepID=UPI0019140A0F|nr:permease [Thiocystis minor]